LTGGGKPPAVTFHPAVDLVALPYSAGTTGLPKGVMLTHRNLVANLCQCEGMRSFESYTEQDVELAVLPFFHIYGMVVGLLLALAQGATVVTMPRFDMEEFLAAAQTYRATVLPVVPPILLGLARHPAVDRHDLSSVRLVFCGAAPLSEDAARAVSRRLGCTVAQGYGMTEASPATHMSPSREKNCKVAAAGWVLPNTEVMVVDPETLRPLGVGAPGELWIRGPQIMKGYLNQPQATAEAITSEGWYRTGDLGYVDGDGYFFVMDRLKELIKYKGQQVAPAELEALLLTHPAIADAAVIPSPDEEAGEVPKAFIAVQAGQHVSAEEVMAFVADKVAPHKRIRRVEFVEQVPKSLYGKILRRVLVERERLSRKEAVRPYAPGPVPGI
jgi:acyl-CoA synthetase (AMP-forming)/AMP-acid ligase II